MSARARRVRALDLAKFALGRRKFLHADAMPKNTRVLALFDVDGTLTEPRKVVSPETLTFLKELREKIAIRGGRLRPR